jgi:hypothetical protein
MLILSNRELYKYAKEEKEKISKSNFKNAKEKISEVSHKINEMNFDECPTSEIILLQECFQKCLAIITKPKLLLP